MMWGLSDRPHTPSDECRFLSWRIIMKQVKAESLIDSK